MSICFICYNGSLPKEKSISVKIDESRKIEIEILKKYQYLGTAILDTNGKV